MAGKSMLMMGRSHQPWGQMAKEAGLIRPSRFPRSHISYDLLRECDEFSETFLCFHFC